MADRSWFYAFEGQQKGPFPEAQFRDLITRGIVRADTLVWTEGMAGWQRAGEIPGLMSGLSAPPPLQRSGADEYGPGALSVEFGVWDFFWRSLLVPISFLLVIPLPWVLVWYSRWFVSHLHVPRRPNLGFTGRPMDIWWCVAVGVVVIAADVSDNQFLNILSAVLQMALYWLLLRWLVANVSSNEQPLGLKFGGSLWAYFGWNILLFLSVFTIIGWAWVCAAQLRWIARNIEGAQREVVFKAKGLEFLWRGFVTGLASMLIIPFPWVMRWFVRWQFSQFVLVERGGYANA
jgi:hypothetical protein